MENDNFVKPTSLAQLQREKNILEMLRLLLWEKDDGKQYSIARACEEVGIVPATWHRWVQEGMTDGPLQQLAGEISNIAYETIIPAYQDIINGLVKMALGQIPDGADFKHIKAADMLAAIKQLAQIIPVKPISEVSGSRQSELEHITSFQPKQINVTHYHGDFIYQGNPNDVKMGEMESIAPVSVEGEFDEVED